MMKTVKRTFAVLLTVLMLMSAVQVGVLNVSAVNASWTINNPTDITDTNAKISSKVTFSSQITCTEGGFYIGTSQSNLKKNAYPDKGISIKSTYIISSFLMSKYKETLTPNTTYYYKIYVVASGTTYTSPVASFKTTGATWTLNSVTNISTTDAKISSRVDFPQSRTCTEGGFYLGTSQNNLRKNAHPDTGLSIKSSYILSSFLMSKYKETLSPNTTYYYKIYVKMNGTTFTSPVGSFKTLPSPTSNYTLSYNANGGNGAPPAQTGGSTYRIPSTVPTRNGYTFAGWATSSSASRAEYDAGGSITISKNTTLYAVWASTSVNLFNLGEETYSFKNYSCKPHGYNCFGMSATCSGFYIGALNLVSINASGKKVHDLSLTSSLKELICRYQGKQGSYANRAIVAGGTSYKNNFKKTNINLDWNEVVNYVKNHAHDGKGDLQIGIRQGSGGHSFNFLRYSEVDGQARIYGYDNNYPGFEIYLYKDSNGKIRRSPTSGTNFSKDANTLINCVALRDVAKYFQVVDGFKDTRVIYADTGSIDVVGIEPYFLDTDEADDSKVMYELPDDQEEVMIIPLEDYASFEYLEEEYSFEEITDDTCGLFTLVNEDDTGVSVGAGLTIFETEPEGNNQNACKWCGKTHEGFFQKIIGFFHNIFAAIFGAKF